MGRGAEVRGESGVCGGPEALGKRGGAEVRGESGVCGGPEALGGSALGGSSVNLVPLMSPKARFKFCCMRLRIRASFGEATWLHPLPPAMKRRQIRTNLGEATRLHALRPAVEATNSALALERLHTTLRRLFWESFGEASEFPVLRILAKF